MEDLELHALNGEVPIAIVGLTATTLRIVERLTQSGLINATSGVYVPSGKKTDIPLVASIFEVAALQDHEYALVVIADDEAKEELLTSALPYITGTPKVIVAGYGHLRFRDSAFHEELGELLVPSLANGYPAVLVHLYQCLVNASRLGLEGVVAEFGMFKGGTTMFLSRVIERLGQTWPVIGFDTFGGFPPRRSPLDMYDHPDCVFTDLAAVKRYLADRNVEIVAGDIVNTSSRLQSDDLIMSFIDTDNYSSAKAALDVVKDRTVIGGAIVLDHFAGGDRFRYTLGERIAGSVLLDDMRYFHLHGTGVFYRQC
jgi:O-methyltransferase